MNLPRHFLLLLLALSCGPAIAASAAAPKRPPPASDLATPDERKPVVELAMRLAKIETPEPIDSSSLPLPFNPPGFGSDSRPVVQTATPSQSPKSYGDREILNALAARVVPGGTMGRGSNLLLNFGKKNLRPGDRITVNFEGQDYSLELVSFDRTNFTLRLNHEEVTRPIKPGKNP